MTIEDVTPKANVAMKIFFMLLTMVFISYSALFAADRPKDFQGMVWGAHISKIEGLVPKKETLPSYLPPDVLEKIKETARAREERGEKIYSRPSDILGALGSEVKAIEYVFVKDLFTQVTIYYGDYPQYLNFVKIYGHLYGAPDTVEKDETMIKHSWVTENDNEAEVTLLYNPLIKSGYLIMKWEAFLKQEAASTSGRDRRTKTDAAEWRPFREDENGNYFFYDDKPGRQDKDVLEIRVKCDLSVKRRNELRVSLKSKVMPTYGISFEEIKCSTKESRNLQFVILSEKGPLKVFQNFQSSNLEAITPGSVAEALYNKVCK